MSVTVFMHLCTCLGHRGLFIELTVFISGLSCRGFTFENNKLYPLINSAYFQHDTRKKRGTCCEAMKAAHCTHWSWIATLRRACTPRSLKSSVRTAGWRSARMTGTASFQSLAPTFVSSVNDYVAAARAALVPGVCAYDVELAAYEVAHQKRHRAELKA
jgi:hypothetical protein